LPEEATWKRCDLNATRGARCLNADCGNTQREKIGTQPGA